MSETQIAPLDRSALIEGEGAQLVRTFDIPKTPAEFRRLMRLPESTVSARSTFQEKESRAREFAIQRAHALPADQFANESAKSIFDYQENSIRRQSADQGLSTRIWRGYITQRLRLAGIKHGRELLETIEGSVDIYHRTDLQPAVLVNLIRDLDPHDETEALRKLNLAFKRARQFYLVPASLNFKWHNKELTDFISVLANTPEDNWQKIHHQFQGRTTALYSSSDFYSAYRAPQHDGLLQIIKQGGLTPEQEETLTQAVVWNQFAGVLPFSRESDKEIKYAPWMDYNDLLNSAAARQIDKYYPYLIDWVAANPDLITPGKIPPQLREEKKTCSGYDLVVSLQHLESTGKLAYLNTLINAGWDRQGIYVAMNGAAYANTDLAKKLEQVDQILTQAIKFQSDPEKVSWIQAFNEYYYNTNHLYSTAVSRYEEYIQNKDDLIKIAIVLNSLPNSEGIKRGELLKWENDKVRINRQELYNYLQRLEGSTDVTKLDRAYANGLRNILFVDRVKVNSSGGISPEELPFYLYLAIHKDRIIPQIFNERGNLTANAALLNEFSRENLSIEDKLMRFLIALCKDQSSLSYELKMAYFDKLHNEEKLAALATLPDEFLATLSTEDQNMIVFFRQLPSRVQIMLAADGKDSLSRLIGNGQLTDAFVVDSINRGYFQEARQLFNDELLATFTPEKRQLVKDCLGLPAEIVRLMSGRSSQWEHYFTDGKPTVTLLKMVAINSTRGEIDQLWGIADLNAFSPADREYWEFYKSIPEKPNVRNYLLLGVADKFSQLVVNGQPTLAFLESAAKAGANPGLIYEIINLIGLDKLPQEEKAFWQYYSQNQNSPFADFLLRHKAQFPQMLVSGQETPFFYQTLIKDDPRAMLEFSKCKPGLSSRQYQDLWRMALSQEVVDNFLAALPKATDEARNAFTGNDYDRTTEFINYLTQRMPSDQFGLTAKDFSTMTDYIRQFGLAKNETIYKYYRFLSLFEHQQIADLPEEIKAGGVTSITELIQRLAEVRKMVFGERQLTDSAELRNLTPFQIQMLANVTRYDSARFGGGRNTNNLAGKINQFASDLEQGLITQLPTGYETESIEASSVKVEFNPDAVKGDYEILKGEILECIDNPSSVDQFKSAVKLVIERRIERINQALSKVTNEKAVIAISRDLGNYQSYLNQLDQVRDIDSLTLSLLGMNFSNEDRSGGEGFTGTDSVMRRIILSKLYQKDGRSPGFLENVRIKLSKDEVTAEGIDEIILTVDEMIKNHVLSLDRKNQEGYWQADVFKAILNDESLRKNFRRITERFNPHAEKLRQEQARFIKTQTGKVSNVRIIPDRGFIGEMAGYLADVCYISVENMLRNYSGETPERPLVVPYKFVTDIPGSSDSRFLGSVLVFETQTAAGEPSLLVRALDIPDEAEIDVSRFTESLLDKFAGVAARRGRLKVQVAGTPMTISNYSATTDHVIGKYVRGKIPDPVSPEFAFNGRNITNQIYTARTIS